MKELVDDKRIEGFLDSLWEATPSLAQRVVAAYFIREHGEAIEAYIKQKINLSGANYSTVVWASKTRKLVRKFKKGPRGYAYNPSLGTLETLYPPPLKTFRLSGRHHESLTFGAGKTVVRVVGYIAASLCVVAVLWLGYAVKKSLEETGEHWVELIRSVLAE